MKRIVLFLLIILPIAAIAQSSGNSYYQKRYNIFFRINSPKVDLSFQNNAYIIETMKNDIEATLLQDGAVPDSLLILSTASPDGNYSFNRWLASARAKSTRELLLRMFPEFKDSHIKVEYLEEDWGGLKQVLKSNPDFPQREEMLAVIESNKNVDIKERELRALKKGWRYLVNNYVYTLRNSSITLCVVMQGEPDEFTLHVPLPKVDGISYYPEFVAPEHPFEPEPRPYDWGHEKMLFAFRTNFVAPLLNIGVEIPIGDRWSIAMEHWYPWFVSKNNKWCTEQMAWFLEGRYWFPGEKYTWTDTQKLQGHAIGMYLAGGYYDYQTKHKGKQGEYFNVGFDYTFALPISQNRFRLEFNIGVGFIYNVYRPYKPSTDYEDLIKDPGIKHMTSTFFGPTRGGVSLVVPITGKYRNGLFDGFKIGGSK